jgi:hypothetical protein
MGEAAPPAKMKAPKDFSNADAANCRPTPTDSARHLPLRTDGHLSCIRVEVTDELSPQIRQPDNVSRIKAPKTRGPAKKLLFHQHRP